MAIHIDHERCAACGKCVRECTFGACTMADKKVSIDPDRCTLCGVCVQSCPKGALSADTVTAAPTGDSTHSGVWVFAERGNDGMLPVALELTGAARRLADQRGSAVTVLLPRGSKMECADLISAGADRVLLCRSEHLEDALDEPYTRWITGLVQERKPEILLFGATGFGRSLAPRVAARLGAGLTADCTALDIDAETGFLRQTRPAFGGNLMATIVSPNHRPQMATVRPGVMPAPEGDPRRRGEVEIVPGPDCKSVVQIVERALKEKKVGIAQAEIIVSAGRGIGSRKNLKLAQALADKLGGQLGVSRPLVDMGWADRASQIGQTGTAVAPRLLIAFGISGAIQHLAGIGGAKSIVAVNTDPQAPIFSVADYKVVGDAAELLQTLLDMDI